MFFDIFFVEYLINQLYVVGVFDFVIVDVDKIEVFFK